MPSSDYTNAVGGGLKLKGPKDAGVDKKKKKKKPKPDASDYKAVVPREKDEVEESAAQKALAEEEQEDMEATKAQAAEAKEFGKTEAQRRHEERRRKRVCSQAMSYSETGPRMLTTTSQLDERLKREGIKTHKERVEELNKYLSGLSEHHDMPRIGPG